MRSEDGVWHDTNKVFWDKAADHWSSLDEPEPDKVQELITKLACPAGSLILDAGCGPALWSVPLAQSGFAVCGVDISPGMVQAARQRAILRCLGAAQAVFINSQLDQLPFPDQTFDGLVCRNVIDFAPEPGAALLELGRVLKSGHMLVLTTLGAFSPAKRQLWRSYLPGGSSAQIANHLLPWELESLLQELGWQIMEQLAGFGSAASGAGNPYTPEFTAQLNDHILQQTVASWWTFVARKP